MKTSPAPFNGIATTFYVGDTNVQLTQDAPAILKISGDGTGTASGQTGWRIGNISTTVSGMVHSALTLASATNYALKQDNAGATTLNAASGQTISIAVAGSQIAGITSTGFSIGAAFDSHLIRSQANGVLFSQNGSTQTARTVTNKAISAISNNVATAAFTVTIPNAAHSAAIRVRLVGSLGAGGAIGANESTQDAEYMINVTRTTGVNAVATIGAVVGQAAAASVAGANNAAVTGTLSAISGAVGATNTFTVNVTIARSAGTSDNHTCLAFAELLNANASGITIA